MAGNYTFRFSVSDPTHTVTRDFVRTVVGSEPPPESGPSPTPGTGSRPRPSGTDPSGQAVPRQPGADGPDGRNRTSSLEKRVSTRVSTLDTTGAAGTVSLQLEALIGHLLASLNRIDPLSIFSGRWRLLDAVDQDGDNLIDALVIEVPGQGVWVVPMGRDRM